MTVQQPISTSTPDLTCPECDGQLVITNVRIKCPHCMTTLVYDGTQYNAYSLTDSVIPYPDVFGPDPSARLMGTRWDPQAKKTIKVWLGSTPKTPYIAHSKRPPIIVDHDLREIAPLEQSYEQAIRRHGSGPASVTITSHRFRQHGIRHDPVNRRRISTS